MLSKGQLAVPCIVNSPLGENTEWVAYPVNVSCTGKSFSASLARSKEITSQLRAIAEGLETDKCQKLTLPSSGEFENMRTQIELWRDKNDYVSDVYFHIAMKFAANVSLWEKSELVAKHLDAISEFAESYKSDKLNDVDVGARYRGNK